jgi:diguanylate cyclase (GGDEF)-like protein/PAS domain S-box-containing protein
LLSDRSAGKIFGSSDEIACVIGFDGRIAEVNAGWMRDLGDNIDKAGSVMYVDLVHPDDRESTVRRIQALKTGRLSAAEIENRFRREDGSYRLLRWHYNVERSEELLYALGHDITDAKPRQADLDADARYRLMVDATEALAVTDANDIYTYVSPGFLPLLGYAPEDLIGKPVASLIHQEDRAVATASRKQAARTIGAHSVSLRFRRKDGSYAWIESRTMSVFDPATGALRETQAVMRDISDRKEAQLAVERQAVTDALTGLDNRLLLNDRLNQALRRLRRTPGLVGVLMLDLDHFKVINDTLGHQIGDGVLVAVAHRLQGLARPDDTVARFGGDEFVIVVQGMRTTSDLTAFAERIVTGLREPLKIGDEEIVNTVSVGIAVTSMSDHLPADLIREADLALYRAKGSGRDRHEVYGEALQVRAIERLETERLLRRAITDKRLVIEYQPIIDLATGLAVEAEALLRVDDSDRGVLLPAEFLSVAEESGLLPVMDEWMRTSALTQFSAWRSNPALSAIGCIAVNATARELVNGEFASVLADRLLETNLEGRHLAIEVTEHVLLQTSNSAMTSLAALRDLGVHIGLDDFGMGYSALSYLQAYPLDYLKIDRSFVERMGSDRRSSSIIAAMIQLAHAMDLVVVAEGIETEDQLSKLRSLGCDRGQGYVFSRPVGALAFAQFLEAQAA